MRLNGTVEALASRRLQAAPLLPPELRADVLVVFGMAVTGTNPLLGVSQEELYGFVSDFKIENPWAQRQSLALCTDYPEEFRGIRATSIFSTFSKGFFSSIGKVFRIFHGHFEPTSLTGAPDRADGVLVSGLS